MSPLTEKISRPSYSGDKGHHEDEKKTTLFRELITRMPGNTSEIIIMLVHLLLVGSSC